MARPSEPITTRCFLPPRFPPGYCGLAACLCPFVRAPMPLLQCHVVPLTFSSWLSAGVFWRPRLVLHDAWVDAHDMDVGVERVSKRMASPVGSPEQRNFCCRLYGALQRRGA